MSAALWARPMAARTRSSMDWGFTDTRVQPRSRRTESFSAVMVSGRPASTVYSAQALRSKAPSSAPMSRSSRAGLRVVGVPPPM